MGAFLGLRENVSPITKATMTTFAKLRRRVLGEFPLQLSTTDVFPPHATIQLSQNDLLNLLMVDPHDLASEAATSAMLYAQFSRFRRALEVEADDAVRAYAQWKSEQSAALEKTMEPKVLKSGKPAAKQGPTSEEAARHYRAQAEYTEVSGLPARLKAQASLLEDLMWAVKMKADMVSSLSQTQGVYNSIDHTEERVAEAGPTPMSRSEIAQGQSEAIASVLMQPAYAPPPAVSPPPPAQQPPVLVQNPDAGTDCEECALVGMREPQYRTPSGLVCKFGHGGAGSVARPGVLPPLPVTPDS